MRGKLRDKRATANRGLPNHDELQQRHPYKRPPAEQWIDQLDDDDENFEEIDNLETDDDLEEEMHKDHFTKK